ncbi:MAG: SurA N-terminal domain-containing protein [Endozoicomonas sp. (ex Botrylloides leachii)]|nr:SurA N-terminal domain-containing protein [Endozoicomonas sp. (ex Botrylloides leachii)]
MLQSMRDRAKSWVTIVIVAIIAFMMAITGLETLAPNPNNPTVASVNGEDITHAQLAHALDQQRRILMQRMGRQFDPSTIDEKAFKEAVLQSLINRTLELQDAEKNGMNVSSEVLDRIIVGMPELQDNGTFDEARYKMLVRNLGMTPAEFKDMLRKEVLLTQLRAGFSASEFVTGAELKQLGSLENQTRDIAWLTLPAAEARAKIKPSEDEIKAYYNEHKDAYMTPEEVVISYIELDKAKLIDKVKLSEEDIHSEYQARIDALKQEVQDQESIASILIAINSKRSDEAAKKRAEEVLNKIKQGESFAKLAKTFSDDPVTADKGGDIGVYKPGFYGPKFDSAVKKLKVGEISGAVKTRYGYQIIKIISEKPPKLPTFAELKASIVSSLKNRKVEDLYQDQSRQLADISFEAADLAQPAEQLGLTIHTSKVFSRTGGQGITANPKVIAAAFSDDTLNLGANSEVLEIAPGRSVVLRVKKHHMPEAIPLKTVRSKIIASIKKEKANEELQEKAKQLIAAIRDGNADKIVKQEGLRWEEKKAIRRNQSGIPRQLVSKAFAMPHPSKDKPTLVSTELPDSDVVLISLSAVHSGQYTKEDEIKMATLRQYLAEGNGQDLFNEYLDSLKASADVKIKGKEKSSS